MRKNPSERFEFVGSCVELDSDLIDWILGRQRDIGGPKPDELDFEDFSSIVPASQFQHEMLDSDWHVRFFASSSPSGVPLIYYVHSGIEWVFAPRSSGFNADIEVDAVKAKLDEKYGPDENPNVTQNPSGRTFIPPQKVADEAAYGLYLRSQMPPSNRCCTPVGLARAKQLKNREPVSVETLKRMRSYFQRHAVDKKGSRWAIDSKGFQAWLLWGGDSGRDWCNRTLDQLRK